jgi:hypothetical protein
MSFMSVQVTTQIEVLCCVLSVMLSSSVNLYTLEVAYDSFGCHVVEHRCSEMASDVPVLDDIRCQARYQMQYKAVQFCKSTKGWVPGI